MAARGQGSFSLYIYIENLKNLLVRNHLTNCYIILQKYSFGDSVPRLFKPFGFVKKHGRQGVGLIFPIYLYRKLEKSSCQKPLDQFHYNLANMFPWWPCTKIVQVIVIRQKTWPLGSGAGLIFPIYLYKKIKNLLLRNRWTEFNVTWKEYCFGDPLPRLFKPSWDVKKHGPQGAGLIFHIYLYRKL